MPNATLDYYNANASQFCADTVDIDMSALRAKFLSLLPDGSLILDAGCGSGRDSKAFLAQGYRVSAFDASPELARLATEVTGQPVATRTFAQVDEVACYDGIWACASLLHLQESDIPHALKQLWIALKPEGVLYVSFKLGDGERTHNGRHFTDATQPRLETWLAGLTDIESVSYWTTQDQRPNRPEEWLNALVYRKPPTTEKLFTGEPDYRFFPQLSAAMARADEVDFAVAFVKTTGLRLLLPELQAAAGRFDKPARMRILTSDYLDVTDPEALRLLLLLQQHGAQVRVYEASGHSFHMKAYLFAHFSPDRQIFGTAFIGSSNISRQALTDGLEWNYRIDYPGDDGFLEARSRFENLFRNPQTVTLTDEWIDRYEARRVPPPRAIAPGSNEKEPPPKPTPVQLEALAALTKTRAEGYSRGLVVLATGLGKTWLAAFDAEQMDAQRVLFVAHREEILNQAAETFLRIRPRARIGFYMGQAREMRVDILCASVQTLGRTDHLVRFSRQHFDYIVIDEFHHAAAPTYRHLLSHFSPKFMLGLTATRDRTDQSNILSLCDDNLVFGCDLFTGITAGLLAPFHYFGIWDETVDYKAIPWRNGRFDPEQLSNKLATLARARQALKQWREKGQQRTLAFCASTRHADYMAEQFTRNDVQAAAVYSGSQMGRGEALERLANGSLQVIFSVDLFNEGVDLPTIDTVLMLRPTESKILFLQQLGRGLRKADGKEKLVVLDFIGNHHSFLHKPQALAQVGSSYRQLAEFARQVQAQQFTLPAGCFIHYDLALIDFLKSLDSDGMAKEYEALKLALGRRPSLSEFYRAGANVTRMRLQYGSWFAFVRAMNDLTDIEMAVSTAHHDFLREVEVTAMTKSFKMVLLEALQELGGWQSPQKLATLAQQSWLVMQRRRGLLMDLSEELRGLADGTDPAWQRYWRANPVNAWCKTDTTNANQGFFKLEELLFTPSFSVEDAMLEPFESVLQELIDYRLAAYEVRRVTTDGTAKVIPFQRKDPSRAELPYFPDLRIACGHFRTSSSEVTEHRSLGDGYGRIDPARHFIARATGNSMNGGKQPIADGDYLLLELVNPANAGSVTGSIMAIERQDEAGDNQYLLRAVTKAKDGSYILKANNPDYQDMVATDNMRTLARFKAIIEPLEMVVGQAFLREDVPALFGEPFNPGNWNVGHVVLNHKKAHILFVTLNKQGSTIDHRYLDHWVDEHSFHWQTQSATTPGSKKGQEIIGHDKLGIAIHLFVRETKLQNGKAAPFLYVGQAHYNSHTGSAPMNVIFDV